jgi:hypothetical protein
MFGFILLLAVVYVLLKNPLVFDKLLLDSKSGARDSVILDQLEESRLEVLDNLKTIKKEMDQPEDNTPIKADRLAENVEGILDNLKTEREIREKMYLIEDATPIEVDSKSEDDIPTKNYSFVGKEKLSISELLFKVLLFLGLLLVAQKYSVLFKIKYLDNKKGGQKNEL